MNVAGKLLKIIVICILVQAEACAVEAEDDELDWFDENTEASYSNINEGQLQFLEKPSKTPVHHHHNTLIVLQESIETGWVKLVQCHENLDEFPSAQIVYNKNKVRDIKLTTHQNIGKAWVQDSSIQLKDIKNNARLCIEAESRALWPQADGTFLMQNGPFMRRFLDGYFPMRVSMDIKLPASLTFISIEPVEQNGFRVVKGKQGIHFDAWFEGKLTTKIRLKYQQQN
jgi:hypothetical protein